MFKVSDKNEYTVLGEKQESLIPVIPAGLYSLEVTRSMFGLNKELKKITRYDDARRPKGGTFLNALNYFDKFFDEEYKEIRNKLGMVNKLNVIFNGKPGSGKTHMACVLAKEYVEKYNAIGLVVDNIDGVDFGSIIDEIRINEKDPNRLIVFVLDELEKNHSGDLKSSRFLGFLDGPSSKENVICIATTNDISEFPTYLHPSHRKGRFEKIWDFSFKNDIELVKESIISLHADLEKPENSELLSNIIESAIDQDIETIDSLRFLVLEKVYEYKKTGSLQAIEPKEEVVKLSEAKEKEVVKLPEPKEEEVYKSADLSEQIRALGEKYGLKISSELLSK
jgi:hypothetical protein